MEYMGFLASFAMGITLGLMGGGGSILTVPILVYLFAITPSLATAYSLLIVGLSALIGSLLYIRKGDVDFHAGLAFAVPSAIGVNFTRGMILPLVPSVIFKIGALELTKEVLIMLTFALLMITASYSMIKRREIKASTKANWYARSFRIGLQGIFVGLIAGFVGAGGGFLIIPALVVMAGLSMKVAVGTSLMIIAAQSLLGFAGDLSRGLYVDWPLIGQILGFALFGIFVGSAAVQKVKEQKLKAAFGWFVLIVGMSIFFEQLRHLRL